MRNEVKSAIYFIALGAGLVAYAHANFSTKGHVEDLKDTIKRIDDRIYKIVRHYDLEK